MAVGVTVVQRAIFAYAVVLSGFQAGPRGPPVWVFFLSLPPSLLPAGSGVVVGGWAVTVEDLLEPLQHLKIVLVLALD